MDNETGTIAQRGIGLSHLNFPSVETLDKLGIIVASKYVFIRLVVCSL